MSAAQYEQSPQHGRLFIGWEPRECGDHRTVGDYRAWCFDCSEWCYARDIDMACKGCEIAHLRTRVMELEPDPLAHHELQGSLNGRWQCACGEGPALGESAHRWFDRHLLELP